MNEGIFGIRRKQMVCDVHLINAERIGRDDVDAGAEISGIAHDCEA